jgi:hypothetical protein
MRFYKNAGPYSGRQPPPKPERAGVTLRKGPQATKAVVGDVNDDWLRGRDGTLHAFYDKRPKTRR